MTSKNTKRTLVICSCQTIDGEKNETVSKHMCEFFNREGRITLFYDEADNGMGDTKSSINYHNGRLVIKRKGTYSSNMVFEKGATVSFAYRTPYGVIPMEATTHALSVEPSQYFHAVIEYELINNEQTSHNVVEIIVK